MDTSIIVAIIAGVASFFGAWFSNQKQIAVILERIDNLSDRVEKHNSVIERVYILEGKVDALEKK